MPINYFDISSLADAIAAADSVRADALDELGDYADLLTDYPDIPDYPPIPDAEDR